MVHNPKHKVHSFRGLLGNGGQDEINLERQNVNLAYRIVKLQLISLAPASATQETVVKIYNVDGKTIDANIDFNETGLLAVAYYENHSNSTDFGGTTVIFDNTLFSRNIYVTGTDGSGGGQSVNYYIEIEEVPVGAATLMQLKLATARTLIGAKMGA